jgi:hypothetical protein
MDDVVVSINVKLFLLGGGLDGILGFENLVKLLKLEHTAVLVTHHLVKIGDFTHSAVLGLGDEEVEDCSLDEAPTAEDDVGSPRDVFKCDWDTELCGEKGDGGKEGREGHALGAHFVAENFDWVQRLHGCPTNGVADLEKVNEGENRSTDGTGDCSSLSLITRVTDVGNGCGYDDTNPGKTTGDIGGEEKRATTDMVD